MNDSTLDAALARGALVVTPNNRLAREISARHDLAQLAGGRSTWPSARAMPWRALIAELTARAQDAGLAVPTRRLDGAQEAALWHAIVSRELAATPLLDATAAAALAAEAWESLHAYGAGGASWRGFADEGPDSVAFARWAETFVRETARLDAIDGARACDVLAHLATGFPGVRELDIVVAGFLECSPQQQRLLDALGSAGASIVHVELAPNAALAPTARLAEATTPRDELLCALDWARERALDNPSTTIGIVVLDLVERRTLVRTLAEERLCAELQWPGHESEARPYDLSLGEPLADVPLVAGALDALALAQSPIALSRAVRLLRSPYLAGSSQAWLARTGLERKWIEQGATKVSLAGWIDALAGIDMAHAMRWKHALDAWRAPSHASPREWVERWRYWLDVIGWLEGRSLDSAEFQALGAWHDLVTQFVRLTVVAPKLSGEEALAALARTARAKTFQPESKGARIRILGPLEAAGIAFDALWVAGLSAETWPQAPSPNPLLPIRWQRERGVPRSHPERELEYALKLTAVLSHAAPEVVFSFAAWSNDHRREPSSLVASLERLPMASARPLSTAEAQYAAGALIEHVEDRKLPSLAAGSRLPGGSGLIDKQSECPFRAAACHRLGAREWPSVHVGLDARERGILVHVALAAFWREVHDKASLDALTETALAQRIEAAVAEARRSLPASRWDAMPGVVAALEAPCVAELVRQWLVEVDRRRPDFAVEHTELEAGVELAGYRSRVRIDRVDQLASGGRAIIDYKTGRTVTKPARWFDARPQAPQLAMYRAGLEQLDAGAPVCALVYGHVNGDEVKAIGIADLPATWPGLALPQALKDLAVPDWNTALAHLDSSIVKLAAACGAGEADVSPRHPSVCNRCHLHAACRIGMGLEHEADDDE